ncbi:MAG: ABC transporter substrate-binding protein, partial [Sediminispirochaetaceae bacterium]
MKKFILVLISILFLFLFSCVKNNESGEDSASSEEEHIGEPVTVKLMVFANEGMLKNYEAIVSRFNESREDIQVEIQNVFGEDWTDYEQTMRSYLLSGKSPDIVDISVIYRDSMIEEGLLMDLMPFAEKADIDFDLYFENQFDGLIVHDALYGIPSGALLMGVFINKDLFGEAGVDIPSLDWENTWTWEEFAEASRKIRDLSTPGNEIYGMTTSFTIGWILPFLMSAGSDFLSVHSSTCTAAEQPALRTFGFLNELMFDDEVSPTIMELIRLQPYQYFIDGNLGMTVDGNWWMEAFRDSTGFEWGVVPLPICEEAATGMYVDCWAVPAASTNGEEAFEVLQFFLEEEQQK